MNVLIPMAGEGKRFRDAGYNVSKPAILTYERRSGRLYPMVVCAALDLYGLNSDGNNAIFVERRFHKTDGTENAIRNVFPKARFLVVDSLTDGQACTCLVAEKLINNDEELLISGCDNGIEYDFARFTEAKKEADVLIFTYRHNEAVLENPNAYGWVETDSMDTVKRVSVKKAISSHPEDDHAIVATFWFREGRMFVRAAQKMISENDRVNNEFYMDQVMNHAIQLGWHVKVFEVDRYIGWGTPKDYESYQKTFDYWRGFWNVIKNNLNE